MNSCWTGPSPVFQNFPTVSTLPLSKSLNLCPTYFPTVWFGWKCTRWKNQRSFHLLSTVPMMYQAISHISSFNPCNNLMQSMSSVFHTKENWVSKKLWYPRTSNWWVKEQGFEPKHCGASCCTVILIPRKSSHSGLRHGRVLPLTDWPFDLRSVPSALWASDFLSLVLN